MRPLYLTKLTILIAIVLGINPGAFAQTTTYNTVGTYTYNVSGTALAIDMAGAQGGGYPAGISVGGKGGRVQCTLNVTPGQTLYIYVGGVGGNVAAGSAGGANGVSGGAGGGQGNGLGAGGGGSSDIRTGGSALSNRILVAAGGGGSGYNYGPTYDENGGDGGGTTGGQGWQGGNQSTCTTGAGGTQTGAGVSGEDCTQASNGTQANGAGGTNTGYLGGGGGGYYGGGDGWYGGGGGGSSYYGGAGVVGGTTTTAYNAGPGYVKITQLCNSTGNIVGNVPVCAGATLSLTNPTAASGTWSSSNTSVATINPSTGVVSGLVPGTTVITYTVSNPCAALATAIVTVNLAPAPIGGTIGGNGCAGLSNNLTDATGAGTWSSSSPANATIGVSSGILTGILPGSTTITFTLASNGCTTSLPLTINPLPNAVTGITNVCAAGAVTSTTTLSDLSSGGTWSSSNSSVATVSLFSGIVSGVAAGTTTISYTLSTGCYATAPVIVNPLPAGISPSSAVVCAGSSVNLTNTGTGTWSSSNGSIAAVGASSGVVTGTGAGAATVTFTLPTGCLTTSSVLVNSIPNPITGATSACAGVIATLGDSTTGGTWSSNNTSLATVAAGFVTAIAPGSVTITYALSTGCNVTKTFVVNPLPTAYSVSGGGGYCVGSSGAHIGLGFSNSGINYQLYNGALSVGPAVPGSNSGLDFGATTIVGTYTVIATDATTSCTSNMSGSVTVSVNPLPNVYTVTGGGGYCPGTPPPHVYLSGSDAGASYTLSVGGVPTGAPPVSGTGSSLDFGPQSVAGTYTVTGLNTATTCSSNMTSSVNVSVNVLPAAYNLSAGNNYCAGGAGVDVSLSGSDPTSHYQLFIGGTPIGGGDYRYRFSS